MERDTEDHVFTCVAPESESVVATLEYARHHRRYRRHVRVYARCVVAKVLQLGDELLSGHGSSLSRATAGRSLELRTNEGPPRRAGLVVRISHQLNVPVEWSPLSS
jgi:hypothetical protein